MNITLVASNKNYKECKQKSMDEWSITLTCHNLESVCKNYIALLDTTCLLQFDTHRLSAVWAK